MNQDESPSYLSFCCEICKSSFKHKFSYRRHLCSHMRTKDGKYKCNRCNIVCNTQKLMLVHYLVHLKHKHDCDKCGFASSSHATLRLHKIKRHSDHKEMHCYFAKCHFTTRYKIDLFKHLSAEHNFDMHPSKTYDHTYSGSNEIPETHVIITTNDQIIQPGITHCKCCKHKQIKTMNASTQANLKTNHVSTQTDVQLSYEADYIEMNEPDIMTILPTRAILHEADPLLSSDVHSFLSDYGEDVSHNVTIPLNDSTKRLNIMQPSKLDVSKTHEILSDAHDNYGLVVNTDMLKVPRRYKCKICRIYFTGRSELDWHKKSHASNHILDGFKCFECQFSSTRWEAIKEHISMAHADLRPLRCTRCSFATRLRKDLNRHIRTHNSERPHLCSTCGKTFVRACHLKNHLLKMHSPEKMK